MGHGAGGIFSCEQATGVAVSGLELLSAKLACMLRSPQPARPSAKHSKAQNSAAQRTRVAVLGAPRPLLLQELGVA